jgi:hypothetical protein
VNTKQLQEYVDSHRKSDYLEGKVGESIVPNWTTWSRGCSTPTSSLMKTASRYGTSRTPGRPGSTTTNHRLGDHAKPCAIWERLPGSGRTSCRWCGVKRSMECVDLERLSHPKR